MQVDHIFIFSNNQGAETDELVSFGLSEGSNRMHPGQGTRNRKFYFENFFLEVVWVFNEHELTNESTGPTRLWERANHKINGSSPFGLCLVNSTDTDSLFEGCLKYRPSYLPAGLSFDIITNEEHPYLPWTCRLPSSAKNMEQEPTNHQVGIKKLTNVKFGIENLDPMNRFIESFRDESKISFQKAEHHCLTLQFDHEKNGKIREFEDLHLVLRY